ncbi:MAG: hypothetical protein PHH28_15055 [Desulfuromonadaceae bacterium]|nr:hypothetical protein [Desulfuromonadaceae bacterium]
MQESASFWTDIKELEEQLANVPDSFCFAQLSDVYHKVGLVDDALYVARQGVKRHPRYLSGQRALALACLTKGLKDEALVALKLIVEALPEDVQSQKLLGRLFVDLGNQSAARKAFRTALEFAPDDVECRIELESLDRLAGLAPSALEPDEDDEAIIEDLEILEDDYPESELPFRDGSCESDLISSPHPDPLSTSTLAELYVTQGFIDKALEIYRVILDDNPMDRATAKRVAELEVLETSLLKSDVEVTTAFEEKTVDESVFNIDSEMFSRETEPRKLAEPDIIPAFKSQQTCAEDVCSDEVAFSVPLAETALSTLDRWLGNIRRIKTCR